MLGKRIFDTLFSIIGIIFLLPVFVLIAIGIKIDSSGPIFFRQVRLGRFGRPFRIYKFRTMVADAELLGNQITIGEDSRITKVGQFLRLYKLDELPQIVNVIKGEMSFVGPRPELRQYVEMFRQDYEEILTFRPGITDLASLKYRNEADILKKFYDPEKEYVSRIMPKKIRLAKEYIKRSSFLFDMTLILKTLLKLFK